MSTIKFSDNPNEETAFVETDDGQRNRAVLTAAVDGEIEFPANPNSTKVSVTVNGVKRKAVAVAAIAGGGGGSGGVSSVNGKTGAVVLGAEDVNAIPQYSTMPTASASNVDEIAQYSGATIPDVPASAVATQTYGSDLTDIVVNVETFVNAFESGFGVDIFGTTVELEYDGSAWMAIAEIEEQSESLFDQDITDWGITFTGTPEAGDTISVEYTPAVVGITNGYFYKSSAEYSDPSATISQTVGSGLSDLSVNVDTFIETEQPSGSETVTFTALITGTDSVSFVTTVGEVSLSGSLADFETFLSSYFSVNTRDNPSGHFRFDGNDDWELLIDGVSYGTAPTSAFEDYNLTLSGTAEANDVIDYECAYDAQLTWSKGGVQVDIADYGISYSGVPADGDTLTVTYTASVITGYAWNQINVQPAAGTTGIEWKTKVDLPAEYTGDGAHIPPYYTITGGLPDGTYEFYFSTKATTDSNEVPLGEVIFKVIMSIDNANATFYGRMGYVFDGNYMNDENNIFGGEAKQLYTLVLKNGSDIILYCPDFPWASDVFGYTTPRLVPECFKLSAIKNVDTGDEYIATGAINLDGSWPTYTTQYSGYVTLTQLVTPPSIPPTVSMFSVSVSDFATQTIRLVGSAVNCSIHLDTPGSELIINFTGKNDNVNITPYSQQIVRATGIFSGCYLAYDISYVYVMGVDTATAATLSGRVNCVCSGLASGGMDMWFDQIPTESLDPLAQFGSQAYRLGTITSDGLGNIAQYTGTTDANYTNGYFYKATGTAVSVPASLVCTETSATSTDITCTDVANTLLEIETATNWDESTVISQINAGSSWEYDADNSILTFIGIDISSAIQYFSFSPAVASGTVTWTSMYTPAHTEIQNGAWERVDVQPAGGGSYLPLTGGTLTGNLEMSNSKVQLHDTTYGFSYWLDAYLSGHLRIGKSSSVNNGDLFISTGPGGSKSIAFGEDGGSIGAVNTKLECVYTNKISNGSNIAVPNTAGTMVVATPPSADGTYVLKATVADGVVTTTWVAE